MVPPNSSKRKGRKGIQLAYPFEISRLQKWPTPWIAQYKLDGERCRAIVRNGRVLLLSSTEDPIEWMDHIEEGVLQLSRHLKVDELELDGELYIHGLPFETIHSMVSRTTNPHPNRREIEFHIFDLPSEETQIVRARKLLTVAKSLPLLGSLKVVTPMLLHSVDDVHQFCDHALSLHYEGFILRDHRAPYVRKRSTGMMKYKEGREDVYPIIGWKEEITEEGLPTGRLGALQCQVEGEAPFWVACGKGIDHEKRSLLWLYRHEMVGQSARVVYQNLTHTGGVPRHGRFIEVVPS